MFYVDGLCPPPIVMMASPHIFDPSLGDVFSTLLYGAVLAVTSKENTLTRLTECVRESRASHLLTSPSIFREVDARKKQQDDRIDCGQPQQERPLPHSKKAFLPHLRMVMLGGEPMTAGMISRWRNEVKLVNLYGVTEACVYQGYCEIPSSCCDEKEGRIRPTESEERQKNDGRVIELMRRTVSAPLRGVSLHLVQTKATHAESAQAAEAAGSARVLCSLTTDCKGKAVFRYNRNKHSKKAGETLPKDEKGEIWIGGDLLDHHSRYINSTSLSLDKFVHHNELGLCFRTGDIAVTALLPRYVLQQQRKEEAEHAAPRVVFKLLGRSDAQVKINGRRIDLDEIESVFTTHFPQSLVVDVAVTVFRNALVGWCVAKNEPTQQHQRTDASRRDGGSLPPLYHHSMTKGHSTKPSFTGDAAITSRAAIATNDSVESLRSDLLRFIALQHLPPSMVPIVFRWISPSLPLTRSGKRARKVLSQMCDSVTANGGDSVSSVDGSVVGYLHQDGDADGEENQFERVVAEVWEQEMGLSSGSLLASSNFLLLGGDSLVAVRVCCSLWRSLQRLISPPSSSSSSFSLSSPSTSSPQRQHHTATLTLEAGVFGEKLGAIGPEALMKRPLLADFAAHVERHVCEWSGNQMIQKEKQTDVQLVSPLAPAQTIEQTVIHGAQDGVKSFICSEREEMMSTLLRRAIVLDDSHALDYILSSNTVTTVMEKDISLLVFACQHGHSSSLSRLLQYADGVVPRRVLAYSHRCRSSDALPLHHAVANTRIRANVVSLLVRRMMQTALVHRHQRDANWCVCARDATGQTPLHYAARAGASRAVVALLLYGDTSPPPASKSSPSSSSSSLSPSSYQNCKNNSGWKVNSTTAVLEAVDQWHRTPLHWAAVNGHPTTVQQLVEVWYQHHTRTCHDSANSGWFGLSSF